MAIVQLTTDIDNVTGTSGADTVLVPSNNANLSGADTIATGAGQDVLEFLRTGPVSMAYSRFAGLSGIDGMDFTAASSMLLSLDDATIVQSDSNLLTLTFDGDPLSLDLRAVSGDVAGTVRINGTGAVSLYDGTDQAVSVANGVNGNVTGGAGRDRLTGGTGNDVLSGGDGQDRIESGSGNDILNGDAGHDLLIGGSGRNTVTGGADADVFVVSAGETLTITDFDASDPYERIDLRAFSGVGFADLAIASNGGDARITLPDGTTITLNGVARGALSPAGFIFSGDPVVSIAAGLGQMPHFGFTDERDEVTGTSGDDVFEVLGSFAKLDGTDTFDGGAGTDTLRIWGEDRALSPSRLTGMTSIEVIDMTGATGNLAVTIDDAVVAQSGNDRIVLRHGANDLLLDTELVADASRVLVEGTGPVTLRNAQGQSITVSSSIAGNIFGGNKDDDVQGGALDDRLRGLEGRDTLNGNAGDDTLDGGADDDRLTGGTGTNIASGGGGTDRFVMSAGENLTITDFDPADRFERVDLRAFAGLKFSDLNPRDTTVGGASATVIDLPDGARLTLNGVAADSLGAGSFLFDGDAVIQRFTLSDGADAFEGGDGNDLIDLIGNLANLDATMDTIDGGGGTDTLRVFGEDRTLGSIRMDALTSVEVIDLTAATGTHVLTLTDTNVARSDTNSILVRHGDSTLMLDTELVDAPGQVVTEGAGRVIMRNVPGQVVKISDRVAGDVTGGNDANTILGGARADRIAGREGDDLIDGRGGNDTLTGGDGFDTVTGGTGDDVLNGGASDDTLISSGGNDSVIGGDGNDSFVIERGAGITTLVDYDPLNFVERIDLTGFSDLSNVGDLQFTNQGADVRVTAANLNVLIRGVQADELDRDDFLFAGQNPLVYNVGPDVQMARLQQLIDGAAEGAVIRLAAGTYSVTESLKIMRSDISLVGAGEGRTVFRTDIDGATPQPTILVTPEDFKIRLDPIVSEAAKGSHTVTLAPGHELEVGDLLYLAQANDEEWLAKTGNTGWAPPEAPEGEELPRDGEDYFLREFRSEIVSISGDTVTLREAMPYTFEAGIATAAQSTYLSNVTLANFSIDGVWGKPDPDLFEVTIDDWEGRSTLEVDGVRDSNLNNITINDSASHAFRLQRVYDITGDNLTHDGAHNKDGGNGYSFMLYEAFANTFTNLTSIDARHAVLFTSYSAEHYNNIHMLYSNRDINFHGSPDADNTIVVDVLDQNYGPGASQFAPVQGGSFPLHPYWTIEDNDVTFRHATTAARNDAIVAHEDGAWISTRTGNDRITGGSGNDTIDGGENGDIMSGGGGRDRFIRQVDDFTDTILDFETGAGGDIMEIKGSGYRRFIDLKLTQEGNDVILDFGPDGFTRLKNTKVADFTAANFAFTRDIEAGKTFTLKADERFVAGTDKSDTFNITAFQTDDDDFAVFAGTGYDVVSIAAGVLKGALADTGSYSGVEQFDISGVRSTLIEVTAPLAAQSDTGRLVLAVGETGNPVLLDVAPLGRGRTLSIDGGREVRLTGGTDHVIKSTDRVGTHITGDDGRDLIFGGRSDDLLKGGAGVDTFLASAGDDTVDGGTGGDIMNGGPGSDIYIVDDSGDRIAESRRWDGVDEVFASVDFRMGRDHIENLTMTGTARLGAGNGLENRIIGNDADNLIDGGPRTDLMAGGGGDDIYLVRDAGDRVIERAGEGTDTIWSFLNFALPDEVENLTLQTTANLNGFGNDAANTLTGNNSDNILAGRGGNDVLRGLGGADRFVFDATSGPGNVDRIVDFTPGEDKIRLIGADLHGMGRGALDPLAFHLGVNPADAADRVIYDQGTGRLWVDADGAPGNDKVLVAILNNAAVLSADDFEIF